MKTPIRVGLLVVALVASACSPPEAVPSTTTAAPTTTSAPTVETSTTTTSTTTTTAVPEPAGEFVTYGFGPEPLLIRYDAEQYVELVMGGDLAGLSDESVTIEVDLDGTTRSLVLPSRDRSTFEVTQDFRPSGGDVTLIVGTQVTTDSLGAADTFEFRETTTSIGFDGTGAFVDDDAGAPGIGIAANPELALFSLIGPVMTEDRVELGDSWTMSIDDDLYGMMEGSVRVGRPNNDDGSTLQRITFDLSIEDLPRVLDTDGTGSVPDVGDLLTGLLMFDEATVELLGFSAEGSGLFDVEQGFFVDATTEITFDFSVSTVSFGTTSSGPISLVQRTTRTFDSVSEPTSFEQTALLDQHSVSPTDIADFRLQAFDRLGAFFADPETARAIDVVVETTPEIGAGFSTMEFTDFGDDFSVPFEELPTVAVQVITTKGRARGLPTIAEELAATWSTGSSVVVDFGGDRVAHRTTIDGREWLIGADAEFVYIAVGDRDLSEEIMETYLADSDPYLWELGDCLTFTDWRDRVGVVPQAPYGESGLVHCAEPHRFEVIHVEDLTASADSGYPSDVAGLAAQACAEPFRDRAGADPLESDLRLMTLSPTEAEWAVGQRYLACLIGLPNERGNVDESPGWVESETTVEPFDVGDCLVLDTTVPCEGEHISEVVAVLEFEAEPGAEYPNVGELYMTLLERCAIPMEAYGVTEGPSDVTASVLTDMGAAWDSGQRTFYCVVQAGADPDAPIHVLGSFKDEWELLNGEFRT